MRHFDNLIVGVGLMIMLLIFMRSVLNSIYPNLFGKILWPINKLFQYLVESIVWIFKVALSLFDIDLEKKKLPGRRK